MDSAFYSLTAFIASQLALMGLTLAPARFWASAPAGGKPAGGEATVGAGK
jgi:hypothetical protein